MKIFLLENQNFCFIRFKTPNDAILGINSVKCAPFNGKILKFEKHNPELFVHNFRDVIAEIYQTQAITGQTGLPNPSFAAAQAQMNAGQISAMINGMPAPHTLPQITGPVPGGAVAAPGMAGIPRNMPTPAAQVAAINQPMVTAKALPASVPLHQECFLEVLDLPPGTSNSEFYTFCQNFGALSVKCRPPTGRVYCDKERREELYTAIDGSAFQQRRIRCRYPVYDGPMSKKYKEDETCRIIVEGVSDPDHKEVGRLLPLRFSAFGKVSGCEILRNRTPACAFIDICLGLGPKTCFRNCLSGPF